MFTVKFLRSNAEGQITNSIACPRYEVYRREPLTESEPVLVTITVYPKFQSREGIEFQVSDIEMPTADAHYDACYIENEAGKTIDTISINPHV